MTFIGGHHLLYALLEGLADIRGVDFGPVIHHEGLELVEGVVTAVADLPLLSLQKKLSNGLSGLHGPVLGQILFLTDQGNHPVLPALQVIHNLGAVLIPACLHLIRKDVAFVVPTGSNKAFSQ